MTIQIQFVIVSMKPHKFRNCIKLLDWLLHWQKLEMFCYRSRFCEWSCTSFFIQILSSTLLVCLTLWKFESCTEWFLVTNEFNDFQIAKLLVWWFWVDLGQEDGTAEEKIDGACADFESHCPSGLIFYRWCFIWWNFT